jgi:hypothetical protein
LFKYYCNLQTSIFMYTKTKLTIVGIKTPKVYPINKKLGKHLQETMAGSQRCLLNIGISKVF